jgi:hypothetical protein
MMEAASNSETLVNFYQTTPCYNPEDFILFFILSAVRTTNPTKCQLFKEDPAQDDYMYTGTADV